MGRRVAYLCLLGWNDATDQDIYTRDELIKAFSLSRVTKSPAVFDMKKLRWVNGQHLRALPPDEFAALLAPQLHELGVTTAADVTPFVHAASAMVAEKVELLNDAAPLGAIQLPPSPTSAGARRARTRKALADSDRRAQPVTATSAMAVERSGRANTLNSAARTIRPRSPTSLPRQGASTRGARFRTQR